jgi:hypothetical protein
MNDQIPPTYIGPTIRPKTKHRIALLDRIICDRVHAVQEFGLTWGTGVDGGYTDGFYDDNASSQLDVMFSAPYTEAPEVVILRREKDSHGLYTGRTIYSAVKDVHQGR